MRGKVTCKSIASSILTDIRTEHKADKITSADELEAIRVVRMIIEFADGMNIDDQCYRHVSLGVLRALLVRATRPHL